MKKIILSGVLFSFLASAEIYRGQVNITNPVYQGVVSAEIWMAPNSFKDQKYIPTSEVVVTEFGSAPCLDCDSPAIAWACMGSMKKTPYERIEMDYKLVLNNEVNLLVHNNMLVKSIYATYPGVLIMSKTDLETDTGTCNANITESQILDSAKLSTPNFVNVEFNRIDIDPANGKYCYLSTSFSNPKMAAPLTFVNEDWQWVLKGLNANYFSQLDLVAKAICYTGRMSNTQLGHYEYFESEDKVTLYPAN